MKMGKGGKGRDRAASFRVKGLNEECVKENFFVKLFFV